MTNGLPKRDQKKLKLEYTFTPLDRRLDALHSCTGIDGETVRICGNCKRLYTYMYRLFHCEGDKFPYIHPSLETMEEILDIPTRTLKRVKADLVKAGLLVEQTVHRKNRYWVHGTEVLVNPRTRKGDNPFSQQFIDKYNLGISEKAQEKLNFIYDEEVPF